jgi:hypothetical protein
MQRNPAAKLNQRNRRIHLDYQATAQPLPATLWAKIPSIHSTASATCLGRPQKDFTGRTRGKKVPAWAAAHSLHDVIQCVASGRMNSSIAAITFLCIHIIINEG